MSHRENKKTSSSNIPEGRDIVPRRVNILQKLQQQKNPQEHNLNHQDITNCESQQKSANITNDWSTYPSPNEPP